MVRLSSVGALTAGREIRWEFGLLGGVYTFACIRSFIFAKSA